MVICKDPDDLPDIDETVVADAADYGTRPVVVICENPDEPTEQVSFYAVVLFLPRIGDHIVLEDGNACEVWKVNFGVFQAKRGSRMLVPQIRARLIHERNKDENPL